MVKSVVVETAEGKLRGIAEKKVVAFKGVRYGEDTAGRRRHRPPVPVSPWEGIRDAVMLGEPCFQFNPDWAPWAEASPGSEDCLFLNVWSPRGSDEAGLPVMVYFHGGAYFYGSGGAPMYDGANLADRGNVVVVTVNHRIHALGFMHLSQFGDAFEDCANVGLQDLVEALRWINRNISAFGGDPANVTIFGESGGGGKVSCILAMPSAKGLFHKAIVQSGSQLNLRGRDEACADTTAIMEKLGIASDAPELLQSVPSGMLWSAFDELFNASPSGSFSGMPFSPVADGRILPFELGSAEALEVSQHVPVMIGTNDDEGIFLFLFQDQTFEVSGEDDALAKLHKIAPADKPKLDVLLSAYRSTYPSKDLLRCLSDIASQIWMGSDAIRQAVGRTQGGCADVYMYRFGWREPFLNGHWSIHAGELPFIFDKLEVDDVWGEAGVLAARARLDPHGKRYHLRDQMIAAWSTFARTGRPSAGSLPWAPYSTREQMTMRFDAELSLARDPFSPELMDLFLNIDAGIGA